MKQKSILCIITKSVWGGAASYVFDLAVHLPAEEYKIDIAAGGEGILARKAKSANIPYHPIRHFQRTVNPLKDVFAFFEILALLFKLKPDIIHTNSSKAGCIGGLAGWCCNLLTRKKARLIFTAHGWAFAEDRPGWQISLIRLTSRLSALFYHKIICVSEYDRRLAAKYGIARPSKLTAIHNGISLPRQFAPRQEAQEILMNKTSPFVIGTLAEWTQNKGLVYLLNAVREIRRRRPYFKFDVILIGSGENPRRDEMHHFVRKHHLHNVHLYDRWLDNAASYFTAFDVFVLPSLKEGLPYTVLEAMLAGLPVVATTAGGIPEIISHNKDGILIPPKDSRLLTEEILQLIDKPQKRKKLGQEAQRKIKENFTLERMARETMKIYDSLPS